MLENILETIRVAEICANKNSRPGAWNPVLLRLVGSSRWSYSCAVDDYDNKVGRIPDAVAYVKICQTYGYWPARAVTRCLQISLRPRVMSFSFNLVRVL